MLGFGILNAPFSVEGAQCMEDFGCDRKSCRHTGMGAMTWDETNIQVTRAAFKNAPR